jgi:hypothetical protein
LTDEYFNNLSSVKDAIIPFYDPVNYQPMNLQGRAEVFLIKKNLACEKLTFL